MKNLKTLTAYLSLGFMLVCLFSGAIITFEFDVANVYESVQNLTNRVSYGNFFRKLHYFSAELFLLSSILHIALEIFLNSKISLKSWTYALLAFFALLVLMFSGYVLKGDLNAISAAQVSFNMIERTPILEYLLPFFKHSDNFYWRYFLIHCIFLPSILLFALYHHAPLFTKYFVVSLAISVVVLYFLPLPKDLNPLIISQEVSGPWFFRGGEKLLIYGYSPHIVVFIFVLPSIFILGIRLFEKSRKNYIFFLILWTVFYAIVSNL